MNKKAIPFCVGLLLAFAAIVYANPAHDLISQASEGVRNKAFFQTVSSAAYPCGLVTKSFFQGFDSQGDAFWSVRCKNGKSYSIMIYNDKNGSTKVMDCSVVKALNQRGAGMAECFEKFR